MRSDTGAGMSLARTAAMATAQLAGWAIDPVANLLLPRACGRFLVAPEAQLLLVPFEGPRDAAVALRALADTRSDIVMVAVAPDRTVRFGLAFVAGDRSLTWGYRIWSAAADRPPWLAPEIGADPSHELRARRMVKQGSPPWVSDAEQEQGFANADLLLSRAFLAHQA